ELERHVEARVSTSPGLDPREVVERVTAAAQELEDPRQSILPAAGNLQHRTGPEPQSHQSGDIGEEAVLEAVDGVEGNVEEDLAVPARGSATSCVSGAAPS